jgi:D-alanyl-D-alanine carboxypeptidase/D-alanyl-D-alanine-endopeptidase (penicillin-binding protein 4)
MALSLPFTTLRGEDKKADRFFNTGSLKAASYSIYAIDAHSGLTILETPQKSLSTASVMKLFTTAASLKILGPGYTFSTRLYQTGKLDRSTGILTGDLILKGGGDPAFYSSWFEEQYKDCFENWIGQLKKNGVQKINGNLLLDLSFTGHASIPGGWVWEDIGNYYGAGVSALTYKDNQYEVHFSSPAASGMKVAIKELYPVMADLVPENRVTSSLLSGDHTIVYNAPGSNQPVIEGTIPVGQTDFIIKASMPDPPLAAGRTFMEKLKESGLQITGDLRKLAPNEDSERTLIGVQLSPPLKDLIVPLNKESLNLFAEHLLCEIGRVKFGEASTDKGVEALHLFCREEGIDTIGFFPTDGSGLSRSNALTAKTLVETIRLMERSPYRDIFFNSMPVAGVDGTLHNAFKGTPLEKNVIAKTGSMARVRSLAGKLTTKNQKTILFAILINNFDLTSAEASKLLEKIVLSLYNDDVPTNR